MIKTESTKIMVTNSSLQDEWLLHNNVATSYFQTQKKLSPKKVRWQEFLAEFDYRLEYKPEKANVVVDALSRKVELATLSMSVGRFYNQMLLVSMCKYTQQVIK